MLQVLAEHISHGLFALELWLKTLAELQPTLNISLDFGANILSNELPKYARKRALFTEHNPLSSRYLCYPESYLNEADHLENSDTSATGTLPIAENKNRVLQQPRAPAFSSALY